MRTFALLLAGCATVAPVPRPHVPAAPVHPPSVISEPPPSIGEAALLGHIRPGPTRPATEAVHFDVDDLPVAAWGSPAKDASLVIRSYGSRYQLSLTGTVYAEVVIGGSPATFSAFTGGPFWTGEPPPCGPGHTGMRVARWTGFVRFSDARMDIEMADGDFDLATCKAIPGQSLSGYAAAIVPGYVYGLRVKQDGGEVLLVLLPRGRLVSAAADPGAPLNTSNTGAFTRLTFPLTPGTAGSASVRLSPASLRLWEQLRKTRAVSAFEDASVPHADLLLGVDVVSTSSSSTSSSDGDRRLGTLSFSSDPDTRYAGLLAAARSRE